MMGLYSIKPWFVPRLRRVEDALATFPDAHFDVIISSMVLEHLLNPFAVVAEIARTLKPGGELLFSTVIRDSLDGRFHDREFN